LYDDSGREEAGFVLCNVGIAGTFFERPVKPGRDFFAHQQKINGGNL
jgi:hypothetical protein